MAAGQLPLWFGFLEAGGKGSPVVRDPSLDTGRSSTVYLFNLRKGRILEYRRDIVETKLRELTAEEAEVAASLQQAFEASRATFTPRAIERPKAAASPRKKPVEEEIEDLELDDDDMPDLDAEDDGGDDEADESKLAD
jgi:hypothetical protein